MRELRLLGFEARISFVDDVHAAFAAHDFAIAVTRFQSFKRGSDFHGATRLVIYRAVHSYAFQDRA